MSSQLILTVAAVAQVGSLLVRTFKSKSSQASSGGGGECSGGNCSRGNCSDGKQKGESKGECSKQCAESKTLNVTLADVRSLLRAFPDFPKKGVLFQDIMPIFRDPGALNCLVEHMATHLVAEFGHVDLIVGLEARGFLFGPMLAMEIGAGFVPVRKSGKLPGAVIEASFEKEYGKDTFSMQQNSVFPKQRVVIVDDLLATGGSLNAACQLLKKFDAEILECLVIIELKDLKGRSNIPVNVTSIFQY